MGSTEASRAKHKFAVKRNSWPKTRGVAMNPVDHPHGVCIPNATLNHKILIKNRVVTINILVRLLRSRDTLHKVKRLVSSLHGELVCCGVLRRSRIRWLDIRGFLIVLGLLASHSCAFRMDWSIARMNTKHDTITCSYCDRQLDAWKRSGVTAHTAFKTKQSEDTRIRKYEMRSEHSHLTVYQLQECLYG